MASRGRLVTSTLFTIQSFGGIDELLKPGVIGAELQASKLEALGVLVDANGDALRRWNQIKDRICDQFDDLPDEIPESGLDVGHSVGPRFGIWIMPDNRFSGMLEDFLVRLIPENSRNLYELAENCVAEVERKRRALQGDSPDEGSGSHLACLAGRARKAASPSGGAPWDAGPQQAGVAGFRQVVPTALRGVGRVLTSLD